VYLCVLCGSENKQRLFHCTALTDWLVFITETQSVYCAVRNGSLNKIKFNFRLSKFCRLPSGYCHQSCLRLKPRTAGFTVNVMWRPVTG